MPSDRAEHPEERAVFLKLGVLLLVPSVSMLLLSAVVGPDSASYVPAEVIRQVGAVLGGFGLLLALLAFGRGVTADAQ